jgi:hypothetical protein
VKAGKRGRRARVETRGLRLPSRQPETRAATKTKWNGVRIVFFFLNRTQECDGDAWSMRVKEARRARPQCFGEKWLESERGLRRKAKEKKKKGRCEKEKKGNRSILKCCRLPPNRAAMVLTWLGRVRRVQRVNVPGFFEVTRSCGVRRGRRCLGGPRVFGRKD